MTRTAATGASGDVLGSVDIDIENINPIVAHVAQFASPPPDQVAAFIAAGKQRRLDAGEDFCAPAQETHELAFIHHGVVRYYTISSDGEETTKDFSFANSLALSLSSAVRNCPAEVAIAAVTECRLTVWPYRLMTLLYREHPEWQKFGRRTSEMLYCREEQHKLALLQLDAGERYRAMFLTLPGERERIRQHLVASYLGIRPQSLSRLKQKLRQRATVDMDRTCYRDTSVTLPMR
jgi:CRP-like cAMP-binding protein